MASKPLLNIDKVKEPFNLGKALHYMEENGEFIRFQHNGQDFYMYQSTETRPVFVNGNGSWSNSIMFELLTDTILQSQRLI